MEVRELISPQISPSLGIYSQAMEVTSPQKLVFVSGITSRDVKGNVVGKGDIRLQTEQVLKNIRAILAEAGADLCDIVKMTVYIRDMNDFDAIHEVRAKYFKSPYPACAMLEVSRLVNPNHLIEIEAIAAVR